MDEYAVPLGSEAYAFLIDKGFHAERSKLETDKYIVYRDQSMQERVPITEVQSLLEAEGLIEHPEQRVPEPMETSTPLPVK